MSHIGKTLFVCGPLVRGEIVVPWERANNISRLPEGHLPPISNSLRFEEHECLYFMGRERGNKEGVDRGKVKGVVSWTAP